MSYLTNCSDSEHYPKGTQMITTLDLVAVVIALGTAIALIATTAIANAKLTKSRDEYREAWLIAKQASYTVCDHIEGE